jgi:hypothetical protein
MFYEHIVHIIWGNGFEFEAPKPRIEPGVYPYTIYNTRYTHPPHPHPHPSMPLSSADVRVP